MATTYKDLSGGNGYKKTTRSFLNQLIDVIAGDVSGSTTRRKYQVFVTGGIGPGVTSSLFQTVYDQDFTLQTSNPVFDVTFGLAPPTSNPSGYADNAKSGVDDNGKYLYPSNSLMMREKTDIYGQFAQTLLGNRNGVFSLPQDVTSAGVNTDRVDAALFIAFKRLFARDQIKRETFAMKFFQSASFPTKSGGSDMPPALTSNGVTNLYSGSRQGQAIFTDIGSAEARYFSPGGQYGYLVNASNTSKAVGLLYYDSGIVVLDVEKCISGSQFASGSIKAMTPTGVMMLGGDGTAGALTAKFIPDLIVSGCIDDIVDHFCYSRMGMEEETSITFQNVTNINSSLIFCRATADEFNFSSNPTYIDSSQTGTNEGRLSIYDPALDDNNQESFTYITTIGLYDNSSSDAPGLLAVAKLSRPVEKNPGRDLTFRVRLDF